MRQLLLTGQKPGVDILLHRQPTQLKELMQMEMQEMKSINWPLDIKKQIMIQDKVMKTGQLTF